MKLLNLGCGETHHIKWTNIDFSSRCTTVICHNLLKGIPFQDNVFDAVYHSHLLEHFSKTNALFLIKECFRVLKPSGIIRVVVPDLEMIVTNYQKSLNGVLNSIEGAEQNYDWMMIELLDQLTRNHSGGEMARYLNNPKIPNKDFIVSRIGDSSFLPSVNPSIIPDKLYLRIISKIKKINTRTILMKLKGFRRTFILFLIRGLLNKDEFKACEEGLFRNSGEIHRWMYDRFSLNRLLENTGFNEIKVCTANESYIPDFNIYQLDVVNGKVRKPESLFIEGLKP